MLTLDIVTKGGDRINLTEYKASGKTPGIFLLRGVNGFGIPKVDTRWFEGAGHGAVYRGSRYGPRDLDLPLLVDGINRNGLKAQTEILDMALADPFNIEVMEGSAKWVLKDCVYVGGGTYSYGVDTDGERELPLIITVRAGQPFWERDTPETVSISAGLNTIDSLGTAPSPPIWTVNGPATLFSAGSPTGQSITWTGNISSGQQVIIDTIRGTVETGSGASIYNELSPAPKFWHLPNGESIIEISGDAGSVSLSWHPRKRLVI